MSFLRTSNSYSCPLLIINPECRQRQVMGIFQITIFFHKHTLYRNFTSPWHIRTCFGRHIHFYCFHSVCKFVFIRNSPKTMLVSANKTVLIHLVIIVYLLKVFEICSPTRLRAPLNISICAESKRSISTLTGN